MKVAVTLIHATREMTNILISLVEGLSVIIFIRDLLFFISCLRLYSMRAKAVILAKWR